TLTEAASGTYTANLTSPSVPGQYHLFVRTTSNAGNAPIRRQDLLLYVRSTLLQRTESPTIQAVDKDGNGRYDLLQVSVPLTINRAAHYIANAVLRSSNGMPLMQARVLANWSPGNQQLTLTFDGRS